MNQHSEKVQEYNGGFLLKSEGKGYIRLEGRDIPLSEELLFADDLDARPVMMFKTKVLEGIEQAFLVRVFDKNNQPQYLDKVKQQTPKDNAYYKQKSENKPQRPNPQIVSAQAPYTYVPEQNTLKAFAPYNFVPLEKTIISVNEDEPAQLSGYIEVELSTETPFFIRKEKSDSAFFTILGQCKVPGSSLRGLLRTMVEMVSWSELKEGFFSDTPLFFRAIADMAKGLRKEYGNRMGVRRGGREHMGGYLFFDADEQVYYIVKASHVKRFSSLDDRKPPVFLNGGCQVYTGRIENKLQQWELGPPQTHLRYELPADVESAYRQDASRSEDINVFKELASGNYDTTGYPVFFVLEQGKYVKTFGHTAFYRIPYDETVKSHVSQAKLAQGLDYAQSIFGDTERAGRIWVEDLSFIQGSRPPLALKNTHKLMAPKPTSFQHYLVQREGFETDAENLQHWGDKHAPIRGYKQYWHRKTSDHPSFDPNDGQSWAIKPEYTDPTLATYQEKIAALPPGSKFMGRIRFDGLRQTELGALLFALDLPHGCRHKLGLGKPLGLGTVHIRTKLHLIDRQIRYAQVFGMQEAWMTGEQGESSPTTYCNAFAQHIGDALGHQVNSWQDLWAHPKLATLKRMLTFNPNEHSARAWLSATRYMGSVKNGKYDPSAYKHRPVLPTPNQVWQHFQAKKNKRP